MDYILAIPYILKKTLQFEDKSSQPHYHLLPLAINLTWFHLVKGQAERQGRYVSSFNSCAYVFGLYSYRHRLSMKDSVKNTFSYLCTTPCKVH